MSKKTLLASAFLGLVAVTTAPAFANPITVDNASFETLPGPLSNGGCGAGCSYSIGQAIPSWVTTGSQTGQFIPGSSGLYFNYLTDGSTVAYTNGGTISQILSTSALDGLTYELQVDLGFRKDGILDPGVITLQIGALSVLATGVASQLSGDWVTYTALLTTTAAEIGAPITISLSSSGVQGDFDNVRLNATAATAIPEPVTLSLFGAGLAGAVVMRRRKKAKPA